MVFFKRLDKGRIYVIRIVLPGDTVIHKIGMTNSPRAVDRMMEILRSWFMAFRFVPYAELKLDMDCDSPAELEKHIHRVLKSKQFVPNHKVDGGTEMFIGVDERRVIQYLRRFNTRNLETELTDKDCSALCQLISP